MSSSIAISVQNLGKCYKIQHQAQRGVKNYRTLGETLSSALTAPLRKLASSFKDQTSDFRPPTSSPSSISHLPSPASPAGSPSPISDLQSSSRSEDFWALRDVSFKVKKGEIVGVIGRNGAGKSTLLKLLSRITEPTTGRIELNGSIASLLEVGTGFHPELTGRENIYLNGAILGMHRSEIRNKFEEIVAFAEVERFLDTPVKRYSSGMYVRLAFSVAAHLQPDILVVDEVLAVGDTQFQKKCLGKMQDVAGEGRTVIFVSHNLQTVKQMCERVIVLGNGELIFDGLPHEGFAFYLGQGSQATATNIDLRTHQRGGPPDRAGFLDVAFASTSGSGSTVFTRSDTIRVTATFQVFEELFSLDIAMSVIHVEGQRVFSESFIDRHERLKLLPGRYSVEVQLPLQYLKLESYFLTLGLCEGVSMCDFVEGIPLPQITDPHADPHFESHRWGIVRIPVEWSLPKQK